MDAGRSALVVAVGEAEPVVGRLRRDLDPVARLGVPAHVTILFPFMPSGQITDDVLLRLSGLFGAVPSFQHAFVKTEWFGDDVLWLASDAAATFRSLTELVADAFPAHQPYEGRFEDVVPHLTIADGGPSSAMRAADLQVQADLPIRATTRDVTLLVEQPSGRWEAAASFALADVRQV